MKEDWNPANMNLLQEILFAKTHADVVRRIYERSGVTLTDNELAGVKAAVIEETKDLLFIHRGSAVAGWMMQVASEAHHAPGFPGIKPADVEREKGLAEKTFEALQREDAAKTGRRMELIEILVEMRDKQGTLCGMIEKLDACPLQTQMSLLASEIGQGLQTLTRGDS